MKSMERLIFHVDVNNAYLSWTAVDLLERGYSIDIRTIPSVIGGDETKRHGIVLAKSPIAKKYGIVTAETLYMARKKCPRVKVFPPDMNLYQRRSKELYSYLLQFTPSVERYSIDESFLDLTGTSFLYQDYYQLAERMKREIKEKFGYTVNIGIAHNKLCAKMASDFEKPDKIHTLFEGEIEQKMWPLPVSDLFMVGKSSVATLKSLGIDTIGELAKADEIILKRIFKSQGSYMKRAANGIDESEVGLGKDAKNKCLSVSRTLPFDVRQKQELKKVLLEQSEEVGRELRKQKCYASTIAITYKNNQFQSYSHQMTLETSICSSEEIYQKVLLLLDRSWREDAIRNIGIRLSDFTDQKRKQLSLFEEQTEEKVDKIQEVVDQIKDKYGNTSILPASMKK